MMLIIISKSSWNFLPMGMHMKLCFVSGEHFSSIQLPWIFNRIFFSNTICSVLAPGMLFLVHKKCILIQSNHSNLVKLVHLFGCAFTKTNDRLITVKNIWNSVAWLLAESYSYAIITMKITEKNYLKLLT